MVKYTVKTLPRNKYSIKSPYTMVAKGLTLHNTYNDAAAVNEISYMQGNNRQVSYHIAVDGLGAFEGVPLNRNAWHAGDGGNGYGNRNHIGVEICYSKSGGAKYDEAETNAIKLTAQMLKDRGWNINKVKKHQDWSGKNCPHRILARSRGWQGILNEVQNELDKLDGKKPSKPRPKPSKKPVRKHTSTKSTYKSVSGSWTGQTLVQGVKGNPVKQLQTKLANNNPPFYPNKQAKNNGIDSYYGGDTANAVKRFQSYYGLTVDSKAGKEVYNKLGGKTSKKPTTSSKLPTGVLRVGDRGNDVRKLQKSLASIYYYPNKNAKNNGIDSIFGGDTKDALQRFQSTHGLKQDGIYGSASRKELLKEMK